jgi:hypothetical protein
MSNKNKIINSIAALLGLNVELEQVKLVDGVTLIEADSFEAGAGVFVVTEEGNVPVPVGDYELETGQILVVQEEGIIFEIKDMPSEEEEEMPAEAPEGEMKKDNMSEGPKAVKRTIESIVKETVFSRVEELSTENDALKNEIAELKKAVELASQKPAEAKEVELSEQPAATPIVHNPENKEAAMTIKYATKRTRTTMDAVLEKLSK